MLHSDPAAFRAAVRGTGTPKLKQYSHEALFLLLEAMGGTWCMYRKNEDDFAKISDSDPHYQTHKDNYNKHKDVLVRQLVYDITVWDSIANPTKHTRYASKHVRDFIEHFKLESNDLASARNQLESSDDDDAPDAPPAAGSHLVEEEASESDSESAPAFKNAYTAPDDSILAGMTAHPEPPDTHAGENEIDTDDAGPTDPASPAAAGAGE